MVQASHHLQRVRALLLRVVRAEVVCVHAWRLQFTLASRVAEAVVEPLRRGDAVLSPNAGRRKHHVVLLKRRYLLRSPLQSAVRAARHDVDVEVAVAEIARPVHRARPTVQPEVARQHVHRVLRKPAAVRPCGAHGSADRVDADAGVVLPYGGGPARKVRELRADARLRVEDVPFRPDRNVARLRPDHRIRRGSHNSVRRADRFARRVREHAAAAHSALRVPRLVVCRPVRLRDPAAT